MTTSDPHSRRRHSSRVPLLLGVLSAALLLAACSAAGAPQFGNVGDNLVDGVPAPVDATGGDKGAASANLADRKIIKTGEVTIEVPNVAAALGRVRAMALTLGGYVGASEAGTLDQSATLTLRIPADKFEDALARLHGMDGDVLSEATREQDVTTAVVDLEARLTNLQASETQYRTLLGQAVKVEDILAVQSRLDDVRGQIEQLQAQHKELTGLADLATLTVTLAPGAVQKAAGNWDPGETVTNAFAALVGVGQAAVTGAIWFGIVWLPALIVLGIVVLLVMRLTPGLRGRMRPTPKE